MSDDSYIYQLSLVVATATVSFTLPYELCVTLLNHFLPVLTHLRSPLPMR